MKVAALVLLFPIVLIFSNCKERVVVDTTELIQSGKAAVFEHVVFFNVKPDADKDQLIRLFQSLGEIEQVIDLKVGGFLDLNDARAMKDYEMSISMGFASQEDYKIYQDHPIHLELKASIADLLEAPPITYDYWLNYF